jgi:protein-S-isoprenylcysteine O-methyltransferase Ste14
MYAVLLWASISTLLATLNWLIAWCLFGAVIVTFRRIETEERILLELYGDQYLEYRQRVSALGPPWWFLGFDQELKSPMHGTPVAGQEKEEQDKDR